MPNLSIQGLSPFRSLHAYLFTGYFTVCHPTYALSVCQTVTSSTVRVVFINRKALTIGFFRLSQAKVF